MIFNNALPRLAILPILAAMVFTVPASAQLMLPGAVTGKPLAAGKAKSGILRLAPGKTRRPRAGGGESGSLGKAPDAEAIVGRPLALNGAAGKLELARHDKQLVVKTLTLTGEQTARPGEACEVKLDLPAPLVAKAAGQPSGLSRYDVALEACPFSFDVLDDAVMLSSPALTCEFKQAECQVAVAGLWGPSPATFTPARIKEIEHARTRWEAAVRASFRDAVARAKDKGEVKDAAREQAGFSSQRETQCRDYASEDKFGFCAARMTQARAFALHARTTQLEAEHAQAGDGKKGNKK